MKMDDCDSKFMRATKMEKSSTAGEDRTTAEECRVTGKILVVDDREAIRTIIASMLRAAGYECREAEGGLGALDALEAEQGFTLVLADLMMADLDGIGLLERVRDKYPDIPVVVVTGSLSPLFAMEPTTIC